MADHFLDPIPGDPPKYNYPCELPIRIFEIEKPRVTPKKEVEESKIIKLPFRFRDGWHHL